VTANPRFVQMRWLRCHRPVRQRNDSVPNRPFIDTWNMTVTPVEGVFKMTRRNEYDVHDPARPIIALPGKP
jgi:hypothetical protein